MDQAERHDNLLADMCKMRIILLIIEMVTLLGSFIFFFVTFSPIGLILTMSSLWVPQIIQNIRNQAKNAPGLCYIIAVSVQHIYVPVFINFCPENMMEYEPNPLVGVIIILITLFEVWIS